VIGIEVQRNRAPPPAVLDSGDLQRDYRRTARAGESGELLAARNDRVHALIAAEVGEDVG
jgi:hypothetical protein